MRTVQVKLFSSFLAIGIVISGCKYDVSQFSGNYTGEMQTLQNGQPNNQGISVRINADSPEHMTAVVHAEGPGGWADWNLEIQSQERASKIHLRSEGPVPFDGDMRANSSKCFQSKHDFSGAQARICMKDNNATIDMMDANTNLNIQLFRVGTQIDAGGMPNLETAGDYTAIQLRDRARKWSFNSRTEYEKLVTAKANFRLNYLNLLPHLSSNSIIGIATFSGVGGLLSSIGDLAPFLLPTRWLSASIGDDNYKAEKFATDIMRLDSMQIVEGLAVFVGRDQVLDIQLKADHDLIAQVSSEVNQAERRGLVAPGSYLGVGSVNSNLDQTVSNLETQIQLEMTGLAQAAGFINPNAIAHLEVAPLGRITQPPKYDLAQLEKDALNRAPELAQLSYLTTAARAGAAARGFQWLDPAGDPSGGLGAGLPTYIQIGTSAIRQLLIARDQLNSNLLRKVTDAYNNYMGELDSYRLADEGCNLQLHRIMTARQILNSSRSAVEANAAVDEVRDALTQMTVDHANLINAEYGWYEYVSLLNRLIRVGPYVLN